MLFHTRHSLLRFFVIMIVSNFVFAWRPKVVSRFGILFHTKTFSTGMKQQSDSFLISSASNEKVKLVRSLMQSNKRKRRSIAELDDIAPDIMSDQRMVVVEGVRAVHDSLFEHGHGLKFVLHTPKQFHGFMLDSGTVSDPEGVDSYSGNSSHEVDNDLIVNDSGDHNTKKHHMLELLMDQLYGPISGPIFRNRVFRVSSKIMQDLSDTVNGQGVLAVVERPSFSVDDFQSKSSDPLVAPVILILDRIADPGNLGSMIRSAYGLGINGVVAVDCCDAWSSKVTRSSMAMNLRIPLIELRSESLVPFLTSFTKCTAAGKFTVVVADGGQSDSKSHTDIDFRQKVSELSTTLLVVIGSEAHGVDPNIHGIIESLNPQVEYVKVPMLRPVESFNAAVAGSIILAEISKQLDRNSKK